MVADVESQHITFEPVNDLRGIRHGIYREECGRRIVLVSPALHSLLRSDMDLVLQNLMVQVDEKMVWAMDLMRDR